MSAAPDSGSLQMAASGDKITGRLRVKFDRKPLHMDEFELLTALKSAGFQWTGFGDKGRWEADGASIHAFDDKTFRARVKAAVKGPGGGVSFYDLEGTAVCITDYVSSWRAFDPNAIDDDLSSIGPSSVQPSDAPTPDAKRPRAQVRTRVARTHAHLTFFSPITVERWR